MFMTSEFIKNHDFLVIYVLCKSQILLLRFSKLENPLTPEILTYDFSVEDKRKVYISASIKGNLAIAIQKQFSSNLLILKFETNDIINQKVHNYPTEENVLGVKWNLLYQYHECLTVFTDSNILLFYLCREMQFKPTWNCVIKISVPGFVKGLSEVGFNWFQNGVFVCGLQNMLFVARPNTVYRGDTKIYRPSLIDVLESKSCSLPDFHPILLRKLFDRGQFYTINQIIMHLYRYLHQFEQNDFIKVPCIPITAFFVN